MTAPQVIQQIEALGGTLALKGDRIAYDIPKAARVLVDVLREHRDEVVEVLRGRQESAKRRLSRWMAAHCALTRNRARVLGSEESLYRDYAAWCVQCGEVRCSRDLFNIILDEKDHSVTGQMRKRIFSQSMDSFPKWQAFVGELNDGLSFTD